MKTSLVPNRFALGLVLAALVTASAADAGHARHQVSGQASVRVWIEGRDVFSDYADVAIWLRPERDCYTTLFMVDTDGFVHVLYPSAPYQDAWLYGGRSYCYRARDLGLDRFDGAGIAYVFAVGSPVPFDYSYYGAGVFVGGFGFRVWGDPFIACRDFYLTLLPRTCRWDYVGVSYARFYVRHWQRYPSYLCHGGSGIHVHVGGACRACGDVYVSYRSSCARPWDVIRPAPKFKQLHDGRRFDDYDDDHYARGGRIERAQPERFKSARAKDARPFAAKQVARPVGREVEFRGAAKVAPARSHERIEAPTTNAKERARVVSTSGARARASVDRADVAAMSKQSNREVRATRTKDAGRASAAREKGTKSKSRQAR